MVNYLSIVAWMRSCGSNPISSTICVLPLKGQEACLSSTQCRVRISQDVPVDGSLNGRASDCGSGGCGFNFRPSPPNSFCYKRKGYYERRSC